MYRLLIFSLSSSLLAFSFSEQQITVLGGDSLPANHWCQSAELQAWKGLIAKNDLNARTTFHISVNCLHHTACLSKKPGLLSVEGVCSNFVRLARAMKSTRFQERFESAIEVLTSKMVRRVVPFLPSVVRSWQNEFQVFREMVLAGMSPEDRDLCLTVFNSPWFEDGVPLDCSTSAWCHYCAPGCCSDEKNFKIRVREALRVLLQSFPSIPLLYRWKGFEPCLQYIIRGTMVHKVLQYCLMGCASTDNQNKLEALDEDSPDLSFSVKQEVRLTKATALLTADQFYESLLQHSVRSCCLNMNIIF